jgi:NADH:ubiquinone reductase (H+-translocating)
MKKKVVILGAGYAGIFATANMINKDVDLTIIDKNKYHQLLQQIYLVASDIKQPKDIALSIHELLREDAWFMYDVIESVDLERRLVKGRRSSIEYKYDYLIVALGASNNYFNIKGVQQYSKSFRSVNDAIKLREGIRTLPLDSDIVIAGAGATGISLAGALSEAFNAGVKITVIEAQQDILAKWDFRISRFAKQLLLDRGVEILTGQSITEITDSSVIMNSQNETKSDLTIWTAGIKGYDLKTSPSIQKTKSGRILVNRYSQIDGFDNVFAVGDISALPLENGNVSPQLGQFAVRQASNVAKNIIRKENDKPMIKLDYLQKGQILSLDKKCVGVMKGRLATGKLCEYAEDFIIDSYITAIKNRGQGLSTATYENDLLSQISTSLNFMTYTAHKVLLSNVLRR